LFQNFDKHFAVVGITEMFLQSIDVFEAFLPRYFKGTQEYLATSNPDILTTNTNTFKPKVSSDIRAIIAANMTKEIDFYYHCKQRLLRQYLSINKR
jgi:dermatan/chondrotin sulfate uronyl 2-O-sulfotransferase UST